MSRPSFLALPRPIVTCILGEKTVEDAIATVKNGEFKGAPAFAIHLEKLAKEDLTDDNLRRIAGCTRRPFMFLHYRGDGRFTDEERVELLTRAIECGAACNPWLFYLRKEYIHPALHNAFSRHHQMPDSMSAGIQKQRNTAPDPSACNPGPLPNPPDPVPDSIQMQPG